MNYIEEGEIHFVSSISMVSQLFAKRKMKGWRQLNNTPGFRDKFSTFYQNMQHGDH
jgi:hypothetical protein